MRKKKDRSTRHWWLPTLDDIPHANLHGKKRRIAIATRLASEKFKYGFRINSEGGYNTKDKDIKWLLKHKYVELKRKRSEGWWSSEHIRYTKIYITNEGKEWLKNV